MAAKCMSVRSHDAWWGHTSTWCLLSRTWTLCHGSQHCTAAIMRPPLHLELPPGPLQLGPYILTSHLVHIHMLACAANPHIECCPTQTSRSVHLPPNQLSSESHSRHPAGRSLRGPLD